RAHRRAPNHLLSFGRQAAYPLNWSHTQALSPRFVSCHVEALTQCTWNGARRSCSEIAGHGPTRHERCKARNGPLEDPVSSLFRHASATDARTPCVRGRLHAGGAMKAGLFGLALTILLISCCHAGAQQITLRATIQVALTERLWGVA